MHILKIRSRLEELTFNMLLYTMDIDKLLSDG